MAGYTDACVDFCTVLLVLDTVTDHASIYGVQRAFSAMVARVAMDSIFLGVCKHGY